MDRKNKLVRWDLNNQSCLWESKNVPLDPDLLFSRSWGDVQAFKVSARADVLRSL